MIRDVKPTRSRQALLPATIVLLAVVPSRQLRAQDSTAARPAAPVDTVAARQAFAAIKPMPAFFMSLAIPGWSQARLDRKLTAGIFLAFEGISLGMTMKSIRELKYLVRTNADSIRIVSKRRERQDWLVLLGFNHLFSGLEGFVSSQLHDFPADVRFRAYPGVVGLEAAVPIRIR